MVAGLPWTVLGTIVGLSVLILVLIALALREPQAPAAKPPPPAAPIKAGPAGPAGSLAEVVAGDPGAASTFLASFVVDPSGATRGETVNIRADGVVLKKGEKFFVVKPDQVLIKDGSLVADPEIDWENAEHAGEQWRSRSHDEIPYDEKGMPVLDKSRK